MKVLFVYSIFLVKLAFTQDLTTLKTLNSKIPTVLRKECACLGELISQLPDDIQSKLADNAQANADANYCFDCNNLTAVASALKSWVDQNNKLNTDFIITKKKPIANCGALQDSLQTPGVQEAANVADDVSSALTKIIPETQELAIAIQKMIDIVMKSYLRKLCSSVTNVASFTKDSNGFCSGLNPTKEDAMIFVQNMADFSQSSDNINTAVTKSTISCINKFSQFSKCNSNATMSSDITSSTTTSNRILQPMPPQGSVQPAPSSLKSSDLSYIYSSQLMQNSAQNLTSPLPSQIDSQTANQLASALAGVLPSPSQFANQASGLISQIESQLGPMPSLPINQTGGLISQIESQLGALPSQIDSKIVKEAANFLSSNGNLKVLLPKLGSIEGCQQISQSQSANAPALSFDSLQMLVKSLPGNTATSSISSATSGNRILADSTTTSSQSSDGCVVKFGSNGEPIVPIPQDALDNAKKSL